MLIKKHISNNTQRKIEIILIFLLPFMFYLAVSFLVSLKGVNLCLWKLFFHKECLGCGITRAFNELFHLNFKMAYEYNPRVFVVAPIFLYLWLRLLYKKLISMNDVQKFKSSL